MLVSATLLIYYRSSLNFMLDDWGFIIYREEGGIGDFLDPHNEHISILPVAVYKFLLSTFGMGSAMPLHVLSVIIFLVSVFVLFLYLKPLVGKPAALIGCSVVLFFGAAWEDLLWAFQIGFSISMATGIGALIMLRRQDGFGDRVACLLLVISVISTSLGIPFAVGAAVCLLTAAREPLLPPLHSRGSCGRLRRLVPGMGPYGRERPQLRECGRRPRIRGEVLFPGGNSCDWSIKVIRSSGDVPSMLVGLLAGLLHSPR